VFLPKSEAGGKKELEKQRPQIKITVTVKSRMDLRLWAMCGDLTIGTLGASDA